MSDKRLDGKCALVTGAGQGVGRGIALALAREGASVTLAGRTESKLVKVADEVSALGARAVVVTGDVGVRADIERMVAHCVEGLDGLDILVNNAQSSFDAPLIDTTDDDIEEVIRTGPVAAFRAMVAALPHLRLQGGSVVNLGSSFAIDGTPGFGAYAMAKEAIRGLTRVASQEWGPFGIRVNTICPSADSPAAEEFLHSLEDPEQFLGQFPLGRIGRTEEDIGRSVAALVSDDLSYLTGATLMLDGGRTLIA
ncbi:SDR family NAD(P)-dependent oxidoreductase [Streptomyces sp. KL116D]|uniref:SDR family NAD(P)-dependent oxidoreductase n=1 Tax=Streptomyces sp. KL116D TaxID=3045152 RepID=UPI003555BFF7